MYDQNAWNMGGGGFIHFYTNWNITIFFWADERASVGEPVYDMDHLATFTVDTYNRGEWIMDLGGVTLSYLDVMFGEGEFSVALSYSRYEQTRGRNS